MLALFLELKPYIGFFSLFGTIFVCGMAWNAIRINNKRFAKIEPEIVTKNQCSRNQEVCSNAIVREVKLLNETTSQYAKDFKALKEQLTELIIEVRIISSKERG